MIGQKIAVTLDPDALEEVLNAFESVMPAYVSTLTGADRQAAISEAPSIFAAAYSLRDDLEAARLAQ